MPFIEHFELLNIVNYDLVETWSARKANSERKLLLHRYPKASGLRERLRSMPASDLGKLLQAGEDGDFFFVVTHDTPELRRFLSWVERSVPSTPTSGAFPPSLDEPQLAPEPGEFTRMFQSPLSPSPSSPPATGSKVQRPASSQVSFPQSPTLANPNLESAQLNTSSDVLTGKVLRSSKSADGPRPSASVPPLEQKPGFEPGELTRLFTAPASQPQRPAREGSSSQVAQAPGEFTKLFNAPMPETALADRLENPQPFIQSAKPLSEPGDFTKIFGRPDQKNSELGPLEPPFKSDSPALGLGEATGIFSSRKPAEFSVPNAPLAGGPSEYTRIFQSSAPLADSAGATSARSTLAPAEAKPPTLQPAPAKQQPASSPVVLIVILAAIAVLAVILILYFLLKR